MKQSGAKDTAVLYLRVSTKKQADKGYSLEEQDIQLPEFCERRGLKVLKTFSDPGESGRTMDRPGFNELLQYCREHKPAFVVVTALSRFARTVDGQGQALATLRTYGTSVLSVSEPNVDDSAAGRFAGHMYGAFNQFFVDQLSERMQRSARLTFDAGRWGRSAPLGYLNTKPTVGPSNLVPDKVRAPLIRRAFELMSTGNYKVTDVHRIVVAEGLTTRRGKPVRLQTFVQLLRSPVYIGFQRSKKYNETKQGLWEPIVEKQTFRAVQLFLEGKNPTTTPHSRNRHEFPLRGTLLCASCKHPLTSGNPKGRSGKTYSYYWCRTAGCRAVKNVRPDKVESQFLELLKELRACPDFERVVLPELKRVWRSGETERVALIKEATAELKEKQDLQERLLNALLKEIITPQTYQAKKEQLEEECDGLEQWLNHLEGQEAMSALFWAFSRNIFTDVAAAWEGATLDKKQMFQKTLFRNGLLYSASEGILNPDKCSLFSELKEVVTAFGTFGVPDGI